MERQTVQALIRPRGYKTFFMLNSAEHGISKAHRNKKYQEIRLFLGSDKPRMLFFPLNKCWHFNIYE